jgi:hypothetical protein
MRKVAGYLFGFMGPRKAEFAALEAEEEARVSAKKAARRAAE